MAATTATSSKLTVLHLGDPVKYNLDLHARFSTDFNIIRPTEVERERDEFMRALRENRWGEFSAIFRPFWGTGGEMGRWDKELVPLLPSSVKVFASAGAGYDWADVDVLGEHGIIYCNGASASSEAVADFALFGILATFRNLTWLTQAARSGSEDVWLHCHDKATAASHNPRGHTLGIIGLGNIGYTIATKAYAAFGMKILYYDLIRKKKESEDAVGATFVDDLGAMLSQCDCVILATPSSPDGSKLINASTLAKFKPGGRFVNIARGSLVDEEALADALDSNRLSAALLDVHEKEPRVNERLVKMQNVTLTCHNAGGTLETHYGFERLAMENIDAVLKGKNPLTPVNMHFLRLK